MRYCVILFMAFFLGCSSPQSDDALVVGAIAGPEAELVEVAKSEAFQQSGLRVKLVEFSDYNLPNEALQDKSIDINIYQHQPYLQEASAARGYHFEVIGKSFIFPMGIYSKKYRDIASLPEGCVIALPNDPSNEARALKLLEDAGLIKLKKDAATLGGAEKIEANPRKFVFQFLDAAQLPRVLPDVGAAVINTTFAIPAGLKPSQDSLFLETKESPYVNLIVMRADNPKKEQIKAFLKAYQSDAVKNKARALFGDGAIAAW